MRSPSAVMSSFLPVFPIASTSTGSALVCGSSDASTFLRAEAWPFRSPYFANGGGTSGAGSAAPTQERMTLVQIQQGLSSPNFRQRDRAIAALRGGDAGTDGIELIARLLIHDERSLREQAVHMLRRYVIHTSTSETALKATARSLMDGRAEYRRFPLAVFEYAAGRCEKLYGARQLVNTLKDADILLAAEIRQVVIRAAEHAPSRAGVLSVLSREMTHPSSWVRSQIGLLFEEMLTFGKMQSEVIAVLCEAANAPEKEKRKVAASYLGKMLCDGTLPAGLESAFARLCEDRFYEVRCLALRARDDAAHRRAALLRETAHVPENKGNQTPAVTPPEPIVAPTVSVAEANVPSSEERAATVVHQVQELLKADADAGMEALVKGLSDSDATVRSAVSEILRSRLQSEPSALIRQLLYQAHHVYGTVWKTMQPELVEIMKTLTPQQRHESLNTYLLERRRWRSTLPLMAAELYRDIASQTNISREEVQVFLTTLDACDRFDIEIKNALLLALDAARKQKSPQKTYADNAYYMVMREALDGTHGESVQCTAKQLLIKANERGDVRAKDLLNRFQPAEPSRILVSTPTRVQEPASIPHTRVDVPSLGITNEAMREPSEPQNAEKMTSQRQAFIDGLAARLMTPEKQHKAAADWGKLVNDGKTETHALPVFLKVAAAVSDNEDHAATSAMTTLAKAIAKDVSSDPSLRRKILHQALETTQSPQIQAGAIRILGQLGARFPVSRWEIDHLMTSAFKAQDDLIRIRAEEALHAIRSNPENQDNGIASAIDLLFMRS